jgi:hypothetical protein
VRAKRKAIADQKRAALVAFLVARTREAFSDGRITTLFGYEGLQRATIRSVLCLRGVSWAMADQMAAGVVADVLLTLAAKRPTWNEGQPEWTIEGGALIERTRCACCHKPLPEERPKFCSDGCKRVHGLRVFRMRNASDEQMVKLISRSPL